jgi:large subunit ribosomal protein L6
MSRIGKQPVMLPEGVTIAVSAGFVEVKGPKGTLKRALPFDIGVTEENKTVVVSPLHQTRDALKLWGTVRAHIANMVKGVTVGYEIKLEIEGVGYRATQKGKDIELALGFSHPVLFPAPEGVDLKVEKNAITVSGISKDAVGKAAAEIRALKKPEPYKGKGIRYAGEVVRRKAGKKATSGS